MSRERVNPWAGLTHQEILLDVDVRLSALEKWRRWVEVIVVLDLIATGGLLLAVVSR